MPLKPLYSISIPSALLYSLQRRRERGRINLKGVRLVEEATVSGEGGDPFAPDVSTKAERERECKILIEINMNINMNININALLKCAQPITYTGLPLSSGLLRDDVDDSRTAAGGGATASGREAASGGHSRAPVHALRDSQQREGAQRVDTSDTTR